MFTPRETDLLYRLRSALTLGAIGSLGVSTLVLASTFVTPVNRDTRRILAVSSLAAAAIARRLAPLSAELTALVEDVEAISTQARNDAGYKSLLGWQPPAPQSSTEVYPSFPTSSAFPGGRFLGADTAADTFPEVADEAPTPLFDWDLLERDRHAWPHLCILAPTGVGKTTLALTLLSQLTGSKYAVLPHYKAITDGLLPHGVTCIAAGRNYGDGIPLSEDSKSPLETLDRLPKGCSASTFLGWLWCEMDRRYSDTLESNPTPITVLVDEYPAWSNLPGVRDAVGTILREARKVNIRLILLSQSWEVRSLGFEGEGSLRDQMKTVYLGSFAVDRAKKLGLRLAGDRPCVVEDVAALVPDPLPKVAWTPCFQAIVEYLRGRAPTVRDILRNSRVIPGYLLDGTGTPTEILTARLEELERLNVVTVNDAGAWSLVQSDTPETLK